jgi:hypothetical protein
LVFLSLGFLIFYKFLLNSNKSMHLLPVFGIKSLVRNRIY